MEFVMSSGHSLKVRGAADILDEVNEARKIVNKVADYLERLGAKVTTYHDNTSQTQKDNVNGIVKFHNSKKRELDVSVHLNANKRTNDPMGVEVLYYSDSAKGQAAKLSAAIAKASGLKDRGAKKRTDLGFLKGTAKRALLIEVCFVDSKADAEIYEKKFYAICEAIAETLTGKQLPKPDPKPDPKPEPEKKPESKPSAPANKKDIHRVKADGKQIGAYSDKANIAIEVEKQLKKGAKQITIEEV